ncbi:uncharacterized protein V6R79_023004 [Siganus canaliculatus]
MAAKVVMVAVPTVLGIASIRVYTVKEVPADGLVPREKLNIYTPLSSSAQLQFVPEKPGVIQSGLTTVRESIQPVAQAVKGAYVSVKRGSVNLYHTGEDVYYYLKDPPPEFIPRFGTITMAGLLGMFLTRRGSQLKKLAVPLGLMSAGASVCYPAQAVSVLKVTGKKVYAAGQWSSAAVSSLLTPKPKPESVTAPQPQAAPEAGSTTESSVQNSSTPEAEVEPAKPDEAIAAVVTEEASTDPVTLSVSGEANGTVPTEEIPVPVQSEESTDTKQAEENVSTEASPDQATLSSEPEIVEAAPAAIEVSSAEAAPVEASPAEAGAMEVSSSEAAPVEPASVEASPGEAAPAEPAPVDPAPVEPSEVALPSEEPPSSKLSDEPSVPVIESAEPQPAPQPEVADSPQVAAVEETPAPALTSPPAQEPAPGSSKGGSGFKPDPAMMDFGQSSPEDEDLYSTRS